VSCTCGAPVNLNKCSIPYPKLISCILFDGPDCSIRNWKDPIFMRKGWQRPFSIVKNPSNIRLKDEAESISVRKGCFLEAIDDTNISDNKVFNLIERA
jgi:hypothetical protein